ncbi:MAG: spore germination protein [Clostridia bacterium]|nr:spore germination protein [Clostridia bacterium]
MKKSKNGFWTLLSLITYKKKDKPEEFYIPEVNEGESRQVSQEKNNDKSTPSTNEKQNTQKDNKGLKKPIPVSELKKEKTESGVKKDENCISCSIDENIDFINRMFNAPVNKDIVVREFNIAGHYKAFITYLSGMADKITISNFILKPLLAKKSVEDAEEDCKLDYILKNVIETHQAKKITSPNEVIYEILNGNTCIYADGCNFYISAETVGFDKRGVDKPQTEGIVSGSQEGFNETLRTNITLVRKIIRNNNLVTEFLTVGERNKNLCSILYIKGLANPAVVQEVKRRINGIKTDFMLGDGMMEQFIEDNTFSIVPTILSTERPDRTASHIMEGRVAILVDGAPFAKIVPVTSHSLFHTPEETYLRWQYGTFIRLIRFLAVALAALLPGLYIGLVGYHREMIPTDLMIAIVKAKENVPFPTLLEILLMEVSFELIREAGIRIPGIIGNTIGIIGALILGQAAVQANIVSPVLIIIIAVTGLGSFAIPNYNLAFGVRIVRFLFILAAAALGYYGITLAFIAIAALILSMKSFGVPFVSHLGPQVRQSHDAILRWPVWKQEYRPDPVNPLDVRRQPKISRKWTAKDPKTGIDRERNNDDEGR